MSINFDNFDFKFSLKPEISAVLSKNFFGQKKMHFLAGDQNSARNFYFRPYYGPFCFPSKFKKWPNLRDFWLWIRLEGRNFGRFVKIFFRPKKYAFSDRRLKIGQKFRFPAEFWPFAKFSNMPFLGDFSKFLTLDVARGQKFRAFCQKFFSAKKICIFWPETKNRPEIYISGRNLPVLLISEMRHFRQF